MSRLAAVLLFALGFLVPPGLALPACGCEADCAGIGEHAGRALSERSCCAGEEAPPAEDDGEHRCGECCTVTMPAGEKLTPRASPRAAHPLVLGPARLLPAGECLLLPPRPADSGALRARAERDPPWERRELPLRL